MFKNDQRKVEVISTTLGEENFAVFAVFAKIREIKFPRNFKKYIDPQN